MIPIIVAPEGTAGVTQQNFKLVALAPVEEEPGTLFAGAFRTLGRMARDLPPALQMTQEFSEGRALRTRSGGTPPLRAISTLQCTWSSSLMECASGLMLKMQP